MHAWVDDDVGAVSPTSSEPDEELGGGGQDSKKQSQERMSTSKKLSHLLLGGKKSALTGNPSTFSKTANERRGVRHQIAYPPTSRWWEPPLKAWLPQCNGEVVLLFWLYATLITILARYTSFCGVPSANGPSYSFCADDWMLLNNTALAGFTVGMFLLLAFRANQAYDRFWEGRKMWGRTREVCRDFSRLVCNHVQCDPLSEDDRADRRRAVDYLSAYAVSMKLHLRGERHIVRDLTEEGTAIGDSVTLSIQDIANIQAASHMPLYCHDVLSSYVADQTRKGKLSDYQLGTINSTVLAVMSDTLGSCERLKNTPIPLSYVLQLRYFLILWLTLKPLHIVALYGWYTILIMGLISFAVLGIESMACEIEEPFGYDRNDLDLDAMCQGICKDTQEILSRHECSNKHHLFDRKAVNELGACQEYGKPDRER